VQGLERTPGEHALNSSGQCHQNCREHEHDGGVRADGADGAVVDLTESERTQRHDTGPRYRPPPLGRTAAGTVLPVLPRLLPVLGVLSLFSGLLPLLRRAVLPRLLPVLAGLRPGTLSILPRLSVLSRLPRLSVLARLPVLARLGRLTPRVGRPPGGRIGRALPGAPGMRAPARRRLTVLVVRLRITHLRF